MTIGQNAKYRCPLCYTVYEPSATAFPLKICPKCEEDTKLKIADRDARMKNPMKKDN